MKNIVSLTLSVVATIVSCMSYTKVAKINNNSNNNCDVKAIDATVEELLNNKPVIIAKAMEKYITQQRQEAFAVMKEQIRKDFDKYTQSAIKLGKIGSKKKVLCYFDPCPLFQQSRQLVRMLAQQLEQKDNDIEINIMPLILSEEHNAALLYVAANKCDSKKFEKLFIASSKMTKYDEEDWQKVVAEAGYTMSELERVAECGQDIKNNMMSANSVGMLQLGCTVLVVESEDGLLKYDVSAV